MIFPKSYNVMNYATEVLFQSIRREDKLKTSAVSIVNVIMSAQYFECDPKIKAIYSNL